MYSLSYSDDAPSTPNTSKQARLVSPNHVSTTPLGPPPFHSTTPTSLPPASSSFAANSQPSSDNQAIPSSPPQPSRESLRGVDEEYDFGESLLGGLPGAGTARDRPIQSSSSRALEDDESYAYVGAIARSLSFPQPTELWEDDDFILTTERIMDSSFANTHTDTSGPTDLPIALGVAVHELVEHWQAAAGQVKESGRIGPEGDLPIEKATFVSSLLLQLRHPPLRNVRPGALAADPVPLTLLEWLRRYHWPFRKEVEEVMTSKPNPTSSVRFWDVLFSLTLHGDLEGALHLLDAADFSHAATAVDDGSDVPGYRGIQLGNTHKVIQRCIQVLESSPGVQRNDWDTRNSDWMLFRKRVSQAVADLEEFAEADNADRFAGDEFGRSGSRLGLSLSQRSRRAESKVPWSVYQHLNYLYGQLLGTRSELVAASADWLEAVLGTVIWWTGDDDDDTLGQSRRKRHSRVDRFVDSHPHEAYMQKLYTTIQTYLTEPESEEDSDLQVSPVDHVEVGIACVLCGHLEGLINILRGWSPVISTAVVEIADAGGWLNASATNAAANGFNESDLLVLSYGGRRLRGVNCDETVVHYADLLAKHARLESATPSGGLEGWQVALQVLRRVKNERIAYERMSKLLDKLDITDSTQVRFTASLCEKLGLSEQSKQLSLRYANHLMDTTHRYGEAVNYYVHAGQSKKISEVFQLLISLSVVHSMAYPPPHQLDKDMLQLCTSPKQTISGFHRLDPEAGDALRTVLSGYATVREYYRLRDQGSADTSARVHKSSAARQKSTTAAQAQRPLANKRRAAAALVTLIQSASDGIHGGLYDENIRSAVPVECVLPLLGEALAFVNQAQPLFTTPQAFAVLKAVEDISMAPSSIYSQSEACLSATVTAYRDPFSTSSPSTALAALKKSTSDLEASNGTFSFIGSGELKSLQGSQETKGSRSTDGSAVLVSMDSKHHTKGIRRGWDWRAGFGYDEDVRGDALLNVLRLHLGNEAARTWIAQG